MLGLGYFPHLKTLCLIHQVRFQCGVGGAKPVCASNPCSDAHAPLRFLADMHAQGVHVQPCAPMQARTPQARAQTQRAQHSGSNPLHTQQEIQDISGLEQCVSLEKLWVVENNLRDIQGLATLTMLRELYLYSNHISRIENLGHLTNLEVGAGAPDQSALLGAQH